MSNVSLNILGEKLERETEYKYTSRADRVPIILKNPAVVESTGDIQDLTSVYREVGNRNITRGYESVNRSTGSSQPFVHRQFQIINNTVAFLPDTQVEVDDTPKKKRVFQNGDWKVLTARGIRPVTKDVPGAHSHRDELADVLSRYGWSTEDWRKIYNTSVSRFGYTFTGIRAGVTDKKIHATRQIYGVRTQDKTKAYHISGIFNSLMMSILMLSAYGRVGLAPNNIKANLQLKSIKHVPIPEVSQDIADLQEEIENTIKSDDDIDDRMEQVAKLQKEREVTVASEYGLIDDKDEFMKDDEIEPPESITSEASAWQKLIERFIS